MWLQKLGNPDVSVVINSHRREYVRRALASVFDQSLERSAYEVLLVKSYRDAEIESEVRERGGVVLDVERRELGPKLLHGARVSRGRIISFLDDDDEFMPEKLEEVLLAFQRHPSLVYYHNSQEFVDRDGKPISGFRENWRRATEKKGPLRVTRRMGAATVNLLLQMDPQFNLSSIAVDRRVILENTHLYQEIPRMFDMATFQCALASGGLLLLDTKRLTRYRVHENNISVVTRGGYKDFIAQTIAFLEPVVQSYKTINDFSRENVGDGGARFMENRCLEDLLALEILSPRMNSHELVKNVLDYFRVAYPSTFVHQMKMLTLLTLSRLSPSAALSVYSRRHFRLADSGF
jgi:glycosyltransferase involved in cell wall biosynthesis